jgi:hypothetical protein
MQTDYTAPLALWVVACLHSCGDGSIAIEPVWVGSGEQGGLAIFVSRLHASVYAALRNASEVDDHRTNWLCIPLQVFDLHAYALETGGTLDCAVTFGFACDDEGALIVEDGAPRVRYFNAGFKLPDRAEDVTFSFDQWVFDAMRMQWEEIGAHAFEESIACTEAMDDSAFARALHSALRAATLTRDECESNGWTVYEARTARWIAAPACTFASPQGTRTLH